MFTSFNQSLTRAVVGTVGTLFCGGICLVSATAPAVAATVSATRAASGPTATVSYADLDTSNVHGRATLDRRIRTAAKTVCATGSSDVAARAAEARCVRDARRAAAAKIA